MNLPAQYQGLDGVDLPPFPLHLAIGIFDGVHLGHRAVVESAVRAARAANGVSGVLTFWPHPSTVFRPESPTRLMHDSRTKTKVLVTLGVDVIVTQPFTAEFAAVPAEDFLPWLKRKLPSLAAIHVGENFRFGHRRKGDAALLEKRAHELGLTVTRVAPVRLGGDAVSSTRVRAGLEAGEMENVNALLGYRYFAEGVVTPGKRLGRTIGFPTLNLPWAPELRPRFGVYAVRVTGVKSTAPLPGVANYGLRPTVENSTEPRLEVHLLGACPFDAGDGLTVEFLCFLRPEMKFAGLGELRAQIARDRDEAAAYFRA